MLCAKHIVMLLVYFVNIVEALQHYRVLVRLRKTGFLVRYVEFVGIDTMAEGKAPAQSKYDTIQKLKPPALFGDLQMFIGLFRFYSKWIAWFEATIIPWREIIKLQPPVGLPPEEVTQEWIQQEQMNVKIFE
jgi:hypothetical protein